MSKSLSISDTNFQHIINLNLKCLQVFGYLDNFETKTKSYGSYFRFGICIGLILLPFFILETINIYLLRNNIREVSEASYLMLTHLVHGIKVYFLCKYSDRLQVLSIQLNRMEFKPKSLNHCKIIKEQTRFSKQLTTVFLSMCVATCLLWGLFPLADTDHMKLPLPCWYPFDTSYSPVFEIIYCYQIVAAAIIGLANISIDTLMSGLIMAICVQLAILNDCLEHIQYFSELSIHGNYIKPTVEIDEIMQKKMEVILVECVIRHNCIFGLAEEFGNLFSTSIMGQFIVSMIIICTTLFELSMVPIASIQFVSLTLYQSCMLLEIFLLCYFGNEVIVQSSQLTNSAYKCHWLKSSGKFKVNLIFLMTRSQFALKLYAGRIFPLSLETFVTIIKTSYSFFAVLNKRHTEL